MTLLLAFARIIDRLNRGIGLVVMYGVFVLMGILLWSSISKTFFVPSLLAQFYEDDAFLKCRGMGDLVEKSLRNLIAD